jgi:hypothetical protein
MASIAEPTVAPKGLSDQEVFLLDSRFTRAPDYMLTTQEYSGVSSHEVAVEVGPRLPILSAPTPWAAPVAQKLVMLPVLAPNWDSYGAQPIDREIVLAAMHLLAHTMPDNAPSPSVVPTSRGGVAFEWHMRGIDLEVEVVTQARFHVYFLDLRSDQEWEAELTSDLAPLVRCLDELTRRG